MEVPLPWERLLWRGRSAMSRGEEYALTDFRLVLIAGDRSDEIALQDIGEVRRTESLLDRLLGVSTIVVEPRRRLRTPFTLRRIRHGDQLAALIELVAGDPQASLDPKSVAEALLWKPKVSRGYSELLPAAAIVVVGILAVAIGVRGKSSSSRIRYSPDDAIYPNGEKRDHAAVMAMMENEVMPWARDALGPIKGGRDHVTCETCHGVDPAARDWRMPGVAALPKPDLADRGWETYSAGMDAQMRNAIYGYLSESDNQAKAAYMREVVLPGMARLLHRPAYDFTKTYDYNRIQNAFGCYHCHRVRD
jgi:hypothetical protein